MTGRVNVPPKKRATEKTLRTMKTCIHSKLTVTPLKMLEPQAEFRLDRRISAEARQS